MTISEKIFELLKERDMSQKEFSEATGIAQGSISDWKRKKTNPVSEKLLIICEVLNISPSELLSGTDGQGKRSNPSDNIIVEKNTELGQFIIGLQQMDNISRDKIMNYAQSLKSQP